MHPTVARVVFAAEVAGLTIEPVEFAEKTRTAEEAAHAIGVEVGQIVKSLVFVLGDEVIVALVSGSNRLDGAALAEAAGKPGTKVGRPDADAVRTATGYAIGGIPPFGHAESIPTFVDEDLLQYALVWAAAGTPNHNFAIKPSELVRVSGGTVCRLAERS